MDYVYTLMPSGMPSHLPGLKENCVVILLRNVNTSFILHQIHQYVLQVEFLYGLTEETLSA